MEMSTVETAKSILTIADRKMSAMFGLFVADATAMPVHWMYDLRQLKKDYGEITGYMKPKDQFIGSIMNLSSTGGGGRGSDKGDIIGDVILHGKKKYWQRGGNNHYHLGLQAGENTLEAQLVRVLCKSIADNGAFDADDFRKRYIKFMTTPGTHNDTYASTCHRMFFANWVKDVAPAQCADNDGHNTDSIDCLTLTVPVILKYADASPEERNKKVKEIIYVIRKTKALDQYAVAFSDMLVSVLNGTDLRVAVEEISPSIKTDVDESRGDPMVACYIDSSFPALLHFAYKYADSPEKAILANANAGGENVARGSLLGALMGAHHGMEAFPAWSQKLHEKTQIIEEINSFIDSTKSKF